MIDISCADTRAYPGESCIESYKNPALETGERPRGFCLCDKIFGVVTKIHTLGGDEERIRSGIGNTMPAAQVGFELHPGTDGKVIVEVVPVGYRDEV